MKKICLLSIACAYLFAGCAGKSTHEGHDCDSEREAHTEEHTHDHEATSKHSSEITFSPEKAKAAGLQTEEIRPGDFTQVIKTTGRILAAQGEETTLVATLSGVVSLGKAPFVEGAAVRRGQTVLSLSSRNLPEGDQVLRIRSAYEAAEKEYERAKALLPDKIVSEKEFNQAKLNYENARAAFDAVNGKQTVSGVAVASPLSGYLKNLQVKDGDYVSVGQSLATVSRSNRLVLQAEVSEKYYSSLPAIRSANFKTPYDDKVYSLGELGGRLLSYGKASDNQSFYIPVTFEFDNKGALIPGSYVEVYLLAAPVPNVLSVPVSALTEAQGIYYVFTQQDQDCYLKKEVTIGDGNGVSIRILSGLEAGDVVVTQAVTQLKLASASGSIPAHTHHH